jgi:two-component system OmpR family sensor kinase
VQDTTVAGSGLGLAIAKEAAIRLGGTISLHQVKDGSGLIFRFTKSINNVLDRAIFDG